MNSDNILLRVVEHEGLETKNDFITSEEFDNNFISVYEDLVSMCETTGVLNYDDSKTYNDAVEQFAMHGGRLYRWINPASGSNVTPGTEAATEYWQEIFPTQLAHRKNSDTKLAEGTAYEVSAQEIYDFIQAGLTTTTNLSISERTSTSFKINSSTGDDITLTEATSEEAGLLSSAKKLILDQTSGINTGDQTLESLGGEAVSNKATDFSTINHELYPSVEAVETRIVAKVAEVVDAAPASLDTLKELADALGNNENFSATITAQIAGKEATANKDASGGYAGLTLFKINFKNVLNTFTSFFTNSNTASRTYTFQDRDGIIADDTDLAGKQSTLVSGTNIKTINGTSLLGSGDVTVGGITIGTTAISSGTNHRILYQSGGVVQQNSKLTYDGSTFTSQAAGGLSSDISMRARNSSNTFNSFEVRGDSTSIFRLSNSSATSSAGLNLLGENQTTLIHSRSCNTGTAALTGFQAAITNAVVTTGLFIDSGSAIGSNGAAALYYSGTAKMNFLNQSSNANGWAFVHTTSDTISTGSTVFAIYPTNGASGGGTIALGTVLGTSVSSLPSSTYGKNTFFIANGTAPTTTGADAFGMFSKDIVAGNAAPHFITENGSIIKIYQETTGVGSATLTGGGGTTLTDTDTFDGYTLKQIVKALRNQGLLA